MEAEELDRELNSDIDDGTFNPTQPPKQEGPSTLEQVGLAVVNTSARMTNDFLIEGIPRFMSDNVRYAMGDPEVRDVWGEHAGVHPRDPDYYNPISHHELNDMIRFIRGQNDPNWAYLRS
jgi:hypothetical protein